MQIKCALWPVSHVIWIWCRSMLINNCNWVYYLEVWNCSCQKWRKAAVDTCESKVNFSSRAVLYNKGCFWSHVNLGNRQKALHWIKMDLRFIVLFQLFLCAVHILIAFSWFSSDWYYLPFPNPGTPTGKNIDGSFANVFLSCFCDVFNVVSSVRILFWLFCFL